ncbi:transposase [Mycoplasma hafezii]|uniref:transposase n=1 Tax=Mycoplasma hafezii TaxID=525886 RepID=UPI003CEF43D3
MFTITSQNTLKQVLNKCNFHKIQNALKDVEYKKRKQVVNMIKPIYNAETKHEALVKFIEFKETYLNKYPRIVLQIEKSLDEMLVFFELPKWIRKYIYTNNISKNFNSAFRKYVKEKCSYVNVQAFNSLTILASIRITRTWNSRKLGNE